ncbi:hypothetical protein [Streptomyces sp. NPDC051310]|uniref:hypothetical protein n=1 Tax=Streptomyces sp. NPDC051310 TaxID=3365649 RepID=UPI0037B60FB3
MRTSRIAVLSALIAVAVLGGPAAAHAADADGAAPSATASSATAIGSSASGSSASGSSASGSSASGATATGFSASDLTAGGPLATTARGAEAGALAGWREGPYTDPGIAAAAAQLTLAVGRATAYYLTQVWDTVRQTTNWWIHYT